MKLVKEPLCKKCGKKLDEDEKEYCGDCKRFVHAYDSGISVFEYNDTIKKMIYDFKYNDMKFYSKFFGEKMAMLVGDYLEVWQPEAIIPVPISKQKYLKRGYNQAELLALEMSKHTDLCMDSKVLYRRKNTKPLKEVKREERKKNLEKAFIVTQNVVKYKKVILVDDIYTTGSTIDECAKALKDAGVQEVYFISLSIGNGI